MFTLVTLVMVILVMDTLAMGTLVMDIILHMAISLTLEMLLLK
jgi:hypothetical protein